MDLNDTSLTEEEQNSGFDESTDETFLLESLPEYPGTLPYAPQSTTENQSVQAAPIEEADNQESSANAAAELLFSASTESQTPPTDTPASSTPVNETAAPSEFQLDDDFINSLKQDLENSTRQRMEREAEIPTVTKAEEIVNTTEIPVDAPEPQVSFDEITPVGDTQPVAQESTEDTSLDNFDFDSLSDDVPQDSNSAQPQETSSTEEEDLSDLIDEEEPAPSKKLMWIGVAAAAVAVMALSVGSVWYYFRVLHAPTHASDTTHAAQNHGNVTHNQSEHTNQHHTTESTDTSAHGEPHDSTAGHSNNTSTHDSHQVDTHHGETHESAQNTAQGDAHSTNETKPSTQHDKRESPTSHGAQSHSANVASAAHGNQHSIANNNHSVSKSEHKSDAHATKTTAAHSAEKPVAKNAHDVANAHQSPAKSHASDTKSSKHGTETNGNKEEHSLSTPHATTEKKSKSIADTHSDKSNSHGSDSHSEKPVKPTKNVEKDIPSSKSTSSYSEETKVAPKPTATPPPANARGIYTVQVYSSPSKDDADEWLDKLRSRGVSNAFVSLQSVRGVTYYRVRFGSYSTRQDADVAAVKLGYASSWVDRIK